MTAMKNSEDKRMVTQAGDGGAAVEGAVLVVGGGIAGVQAALDLANTGFFIYLVERSAAIGGVMAQLDKTFPTNDCSMCILSPKLVECSRHPNIQVLTLAEVDALRGEVGNFEVKVKQRPRYIDIEKCIACGVCAEKCPKKADDEFNAGLSKRKSCYLKYPQAVPLKYAIDAGTCIYFAKGKGKCRACEKFCPAGAVRFDEQERRISLRVGAVIVAPGFQSFDPKVLDTYLYGKHPNVVTSLEFERVLSASGPYRGHLLRPSDQREPQKIAWIQCVGSRALQPGDNDYCSGVCCMYAIKEAVVAKEHARGPLETAIFFMDMRTYGKDFEKYYNRARDDYGVRFIRSRVHTLYPDSEGDSLTVEWVNETGEGLAERFDMVVLSVGVEVPESARDLAHRLGIELDRHHFAVNRQSLLPVHTSRPGVYSCGMFQGPMDIPQAVTAASAAACAAATDLASVRGSLVKVRETPPELDLASAEPRIGVFVCNCGINIGSVVDVKDLVRYAASLPYVVWAEENLFTCSQDTQEKMKKLIGEHSLNRVVVAACSPHTHEPLFQETLKASGINRYLFDMANIRDQDSWVHSQNPDKATAKAKDLVRKAVARASLLKPLVERPLEIVQRALVIGGGVAGLNAALMLARQGFEVVIVERARELGGMARRIYQTIEGVDVQAYLDLLVAEVRGHEKIQVLTQALIVRFSGQKGTFTTEVLVGPGMYERKIQHGVAVVATGAQEYRPKEYLYNEDLRVMTQSELEQRLHEHRLDVAGWNRVVMIQCVGSRNQENPGCSRICCQTAVKNALELKRRNADLDIYILYRDLRTYGLLETYYTEARRQGVIFSRFGLDHPPEVRKQGGVLNVSFEDHVLRRPMVMPVDAVILSAATVAAEQEELASLVKLPVNSEGFFIEAHAKLRPVDFPSQGIYLCGTAHSPMLIRESISQALAAASRAASFLASTALTVGGVVARVDQSRCAACLVCVMSCPYGVPRINEDNVSEINEAMCHGCGICAAECPAKAIQLSHYQDDQINVELQAVLEGAL
jgi:heterodisulfide reductase subunit A